LNRWYFDHNATTPVLPEALAAFVGAARDVFGNASSVHCEGQSARKLLETARLQVCALLGCSSKELVLTSGGTEADNLAIFGAVRAASRRDKHVITSGIEHPAVLSACAELERQGVPVTYVAPDRSGVVSADAVREALRDETVLVSVMHVNNETGVIQPIAEIADAAPRAGALMHSDGVQAAGKIDVDVNALGVDFYAISGHKFGAPKGAGALFVRESAALRPLHFGGRHERNRRAGTENVCGAAALGAAAVSSRANRRSEGIRLATLRDRLERGILVMVPNVVINGAGAARVPNTTNLCFDGIEGEGMVIGLDLRGFAISSGSACSSGAVEPSHVLIAMGLPAARAKSSLRFSLGPGNTEEQVDRLIDAVSAACAHLRRLSPTYATPL
jgi:cysteine desulfurase